MEKKESKMLTKEKILKGERKNSFSFLKTFFDMDHFKILYWICYNIAFVLFFCFLSTMHVESQLPNQGSNPCYLHWKAKSSTGLPGKSWKLFFFLSSSSYSFFFFLYCLRTMTGNTGVLCTILTWIFIQKEAEGNLKGSSVYIMSLSIVVTFC